MRRSLALVPALVALAGVLPTDDASACGGFAFRRSTSPPYLAEELVLIDHDGETEDFVREVRFRGANEHFGFVVPTPSRPSVDKAKSPFAELRQRFPHETPRELARTGYDGDTPWPRGGGLGIGLGDLGGFGHGAGIGGGKGVGSGKPGGGVTVLEEKRVGSFTAFVLQADDEKSLTQWLEKNELAMSKEAEAWVGRYVTRRFFFTAFRYEKPKEGAKELVSETVRLTFATKTPYYPYEEPAGAVERPLRALQVWAVTRSAVVPVALRVEDDELVWKRPWRGGKPFTAGRDLEAALGKPHGPAVVSVWKDDKISRAGWGDALLVPAKPEPLDDAGKTARAMLAGLLVADAGAPPPVVPTRDAPVQRLPKTTSRDDQLALAWALLGGAKPDADLPTESYDPTLSAPPTYSTVSRSMVNITGDAATPGLPIEVFTRVARQRMGSVRQCYDTLLFDDPGLRATVKVTVIVSPKGEVKVGPPASPKDKPFVGCAERALASAKFPEPEGGKTVTATLDYKFVPRAP